MTIARLILAVVILLASVLYSKRYCRSPRTRPMTSSLTRGALWDFRMQQMSCPTFPYFWWGYTVLRGHSRPVVLLTGCRAE